MASTAPKTDFIAGDGLTYAQINALEENVRMLQGGDATLPLSTDAATGKALAKRDANGDIAFRNMVASGLVSAGSLGGTAFGAGWITQIGLSLDYIAGEYQLAIDDRTNTRATTMYSPTTRPLYVNRNGVIRVRFTLGQESPGTGYARIYINGGAIGKERVGPGTYTEDISVSAGDYITIYSHGTSGYDSYVSSFMLLHGNAI